MAHWWCSECKQAILPRNVTYDKYHDVCGMPVQWIEGEELSKCEQLEENIAILTAQVAQQEQWAELGRLAVDAISSGQTAICLKTEICEDCAWKKFCAKRAELAEGGNGSE